MCNQRYTNFFCILFTVGQGLLPLLQFLLKVSLKWLWKTLYIIYPIIRGMFSLVPKYAMYNLLFCAFHCNDLQL